MGSMGSLCKAMVTTTEASQPISICKCSKHRKSGHLRKDSNASVVHLFESSNGSLELFHVSYCLGVLKRVAKRSSFLHCSPKPVDTRSYDMLVFVLLKHIRAFLVHVTGVIDDVYSMFDTHLDRVPNTRMGT